jgi:hypothetical protein
VEDAVDPVTDPERFLLRLDVDVGGAIVHRLGDEQVHELDDRSVVGSRLRDHRLEALVFDPHVGGGLLDERLGRAVEPVVTADRGQHVDFRGDHRLDVSLRERADVVEGHHVGGVGHRQYETAVVLETNWNAVVPPRGLFGKEGYCRGVNVRLAEIYELEPDLLRQNRYEPRLRHETELDEDAAQRAPPLRRLEPRLLELLLCDESARQQQLVQLPPRRLRWGTHTHVFLLPGPHTPGRSALDALSFIGGARTD